MQVAFDLRVPDLDLECLESLRRRLREQPFKFIVAQVEVEIDASFGTKPILTNGVRPRILSASLSAKAAFS